MSWLDDILESTKELEAPRSYFYWSALTAVAAVLRKNVWIDRGGAYKLYPNIYTLLVGKSGTKKSIPWWMCRALVSEVSNTRIIDGRSSIEGVIKELSTATTSEKGKGPPIVDGTALVTSEEMSTLLVSNPESYKILTTWYDTHNHDKTGWTNTLKVAGKEKIQNLCITIFGASNQVLLKDALPPYAYKGGFVARLFVVEDEQRGPRNALTEKVPIKLYERIGEYASYLKQLAQVRGEVDYEDDARAYYKKWYDALNEDAYGDPTGTASRLGDAVLKVATLLNFTERTEKKLTLWSIEQGIKLCTKFIESNKNLMAGTGRSTFGPQTAMVIQELAYADKHEVKRSDLLQKYYGDFSAAELDVVIQTLLDNHHIDVIYAEGDRIYKLKKAWAEKYKEYRAKVDQRRKASGDSGD